ncbi:hypothetical protein HYH03_009929 [Edaphochlamys debaryana]|uniref:phytol kinase n=1 Tax=Edaphochlamys debaryana TaxID=47281 RepID=A0A835XZA4_9CHLO|nr:hypothetical protein HYH03_009929 [Edaphochlamys debaryana]|eukprot:KAG2491768.1 hypothetical protein HYH03_009929 [Edaphochlamys debaryana]
MPRPVARRGLGGRRRGGSGDAHEEKEEEASNNTNSAAGWHNGPAPLPRSLQDWSGRLLQSVGTGPAIPLTRDELQQVQDALERADARAFFGEERLRFATAVEVLFDEELRASLLRLVAFAVRLPAPDGGVETPDRQQQREVGFIACRLAGSMLELSARFGPEGQQEFAASLLRMQTLHAAARQLAAGAAALERGPAPPSPALCVACLRCVSQALCSVTGMSKPGLDAAIQATLVGDLAATHVLEHAARVLLLTAATPGAGAERSRAGSLLATAYADLSVLSICFAKETSADAASGASPPAATEGAPELAAARAGRPAAAAATAVGGQPLPSGGAGASSSTEPLPVQQLIQVLTGPCVRHAVFVLGLGALGELEGGAEERGGGPCACTGAGPRPAEETPGSGLAPVLHAVVQSLRAAAAPGIVGEALAGGGNIPRSLAAMRLLLRLGSAVARDAVGGGQAAGPSEGGGAGGSGSGAGAGAGGHSGGAPVHTPRLSASCRMALAEGVLAGLLQRVMLTPPSSRQGPWPGLVEDTWRLTAALLGREVLCAGTTPLSEAHRTLLGSHLQDLLVACCHGLTVADDEGIWWRLSPAPTPGLSAALAGGALPLLERLLRRAGEDPAGPEASILHHASYQEALLPLLAHGEPLQAGALVATVTKLLRRTEPGVLLRGDLDQACSGLFLVGNLPVEACGIRFPDSVAAPAADSDPSPAALASDTLPDMASPSPGGPHAASPAAGRLALVLSLALPEWLPELSRLVREAAAVDEAAWAEEQERAQVQEASGAGGGAGSVEAGGEGGCVGGAEGAAATSAAGPELLYASFKLVLEQLDSSDPRANVWADPRADVSAPPEAADASAWWWGTVLEASDVVGLVGAALRLLERRRPCTEEWVELYVATVYWALRLFDFHRGDLRCACADPASPSACWRPEAVRALAGAMSGGGLEEFVVDGLDELARCLEAWAAGEEADPSSATFIPSEPHWWAPLLVPPTEARRRLGLPPACSNPACASLAGDSEAGLRRQQCGRCGRASYCCRECQVAHWKAGHKEACGKAAVVE